MDDAAGILGEYLIREVKPELDELIRNRPRISENLYKKALELAEEN